MKKTKKNAIVLTTAALGVSALAGCGIVKSEQEKFITAYENSSDFAGTVTSKIYLSGGIGKQLGSPEFDKMIEGAYIEVVQVQNESLDKLEARTKLVIPVNHEDIGEDIKVDLDLNFYIDLNEKVAYFDASALIASLERVLEQADKFNAEGLGLGSSAELKGAIEYIKETVYLEIEDVTGEEYEKDKKFYIKADISGDEFAEVFELTKDENLKESNEAVVEILKVFEKEKFADGKFGFNIIEIVDAVKTALEKGVIESIGEEEITVEDLEDLKEELKEGLGEKGNIEFTADYSIKKGQFETLDLDVAVTSEDLNFVVHVDSKFSDELKYSFDVKSKNAVIVDYTDIDLSKYTGSDDYYEDEYYEEDYSDEDYGW